jgi:hypothetical protein
MKATALMTAVAVLVLSCLPELALATSRLPVDGTKLHFKTEAEVRAMMGPPDAKIVVEPGRVIWLYNKKVKNAFGDMAYPEIHFLQGEVRGIQWLSEERIAERLKEGKR